MKAIEAKIVVLGSQGVGKTSLVSRYITQTWPQEVVPTIGASFFTCKISLEDIKVKMQIWDTAGQERFKAMAPLYYRNANAALLVFDITNYNSFVDIKLWVHELQRNVLEPMVLTLVGSKTDLEERRAVSREEAFLYASAIGGNYEETSAMQDRGIEQVFLRTALGLAQLAGDRQCSSLKRYESVESIDMRYLMATNGGSSLSRGIPAEEDDEIGVGGVDGMGRLEIASWSIDHIAHGDEEASGFCCY